MNAPPVASAPARSGVTFVADPTWRDGEAAVRAWLATAGAPPPDRLMRLDLEELGDLLIHYARSQPDPLRLAVVFSGGGAKCSYQAGAIRDRGRARPPEGTDRRELLGHLSRRRHLGRSDQRPAGRDGDVGFSGAVRADGSGLALARPARHCTPGAPGAFEYGDVVRVTPVPALLPDLAPPPA